MATPLEKINIIPQNSCGNNFLVDVFSKKIEPNEIFSSLKPLANIFSKYQKSCFRIAKYNEKKKYTNIVENLKKEISDLKEQLNSSQKKYENLKIINNELIVNLNNKNNIINTLEKTLLEYKNDDNNNLTLKKKIR